MADLAALQVQLELQTAAFQAGVKQVDRQLRQMDRRFGESAKATKRLEDSFTRLKKGALVVTAALAAIGTIKGITSSAAQYQELANTLEVVTGSAEEGAAAFENLKKIVQATPFGLDQLTNSYIKLKASGIEPTNKLMMLFSDVASVTTDRIGTLQAITDLFSRTTAGGLGLEELNRLADRGIPVFDILEKKMGLARLQVSEFGKSAEGAKQILSVLTDELQNRFGGASEKNVNNLTVAFSNFQEALKNINAEIFNSTGLSNALVYSLNTISSALDSSLKNIKQFAKDISDSAVAITLLTPAVIALSGAITTKLIVSLKALAIVSLANPITALISIIAGGAALIVANWDKVKLLFTEQIPRWAIQAAIGWQKFMKSIALSDSAIRSAQEEIDRLNVSLSKIGADREFAEWMDDLDSLGDPFADFTGGADAAGNAMTSFSDKVAKALSEATGFNALAEELGILNAALREAERLGDTGAIEALLAKIAKLEGFDLSDASSEVSKFDKAVSDLLSDPTGYDELAFQLGALQAAIDKTTDPAKLEALYDLQEALTFGDLGETAKGLTEFEQRMEQLGQGFTRAFTDTIVDGVAEGKLAFDDLAKSFAAMVAKMIIEAQAAKVVQMLLNSFNIGGSTGGASAGGGGPIFRAVTIPGTKTLQGGSTVGQIKAPTYGEFGGASGSRGGINVVVNNNSKAEVQTRESQGPNGMEIEIMIEEAVSKQMAGGAYDRTLQSRYGLNRRGY